VHGAHFHVRGSLAANSDLRAINLEYARVAAWGGQGGGDPAPRSKTQLHETPRLGFRQVNLFHNALLAAAQFAQQDEFSVDTQLQLTV